jgi:hypothetical protein
MVERHPVDFEGATRFATALVLGGIPALAALEKPARARKPNDRRTGRRTR